MENEYEIISDISRRARVYWIDSVAFVHMMTPTTNFHRCIQGPPPNAVVTGRGFDPTRNSFYLTVVHPTFDEVEPYGILPDHNVIFEAWVDRR